MARPPEPADRPAGPGRRLVPGDLSVATAAAAVDILVVGEINPDIVVADPDPVPVFGEVERLVGSVRLTVGSSSAIFACGAARLGCGSRSPASWATTRSGGSCSTSWRPAGSTPTACIVDPARPTGATVILTSGSDRAMLTALGTIDALDVDAVPRAIGRAGSPPPLGRVLPPGAGPASGCRRSSPRPASAAGRRRSTRTGTRRGDGTTTSSTCSGSPTCSCRTPRRPAGSPASTTSRRPRWRSRGPGRPGGRTAGRRSRSSSGPTARSRPGRTARSCASRRCRSTRSTRRAPAIPSTPGSCAPGSTARRSAIASSSAPPAAPCRRGRPAAWTPSRRSPRRGPRWRPRPGDLMAGPRRRLLFVAANPSIDRLYELDELTVGEIHRPATTTAVPGGKGLNAARAAAALGGDVTAVAIVGGRSGDWIVDRLAALALDVRAIRVAGETRTCISILDRSSGALTEVYEPGAADRAGGLGGGRGGRRVGARARRRGRGRDLGQPAAGRAVRRVRPDRPAGEWCGAVPSGRGPRRHVRPGAGRGPGRAARAGQGQRRRGRRGDRRRGHRRPLRGCGGGRASAMPGPRP